MCGKDARALFLASAGETQMSKNGVLQVALAGYCVALSACSASEQQEEMEFQVGGGQVQAGLQATYDATLRAPRCLGSNTSCESGTLLVGRATLGPEANAPNTIGTACADGTGGVFHSDESLDVLRVVSVDGTPLQSGKTARIEATVWAYSSFASDKLDLYYAANAGSPTWVFIATLTPTAAGAQTLNTTYTLPPGALQAIRGSFRYGGNAATCPSGSFNDRDDLVFAVNYTDPTPPSVTLTSPASGAVLSGVATLSATASDNVGVQRVEFYRGTTLLGTDTTAPYSYAWTTTSVVNGAYSLTARAFDTQGNQTTSTAVGITVTNETTPPTVSLTSPATGAVLAGTVTVTATASDNVGVQRVDFYRGATLLGSDTTAPYSYAWNTTTVANGAYSLTARAFDAAGNQATSAAAAITVNNDTISPTVSLTSPAPGAVLAGVATLTATATDNVGVTRVEFYRGTTLLGSDTTAPYSYAWNTLTVANGAYSLQARAYDAAGRMGTSTSVSVTVNNDTTAPSVSLTSPTSGATVTGLVTLTATATDNVAVARVDFYRDAVLLGTDTTAPYSYAWTTTTVANGGYALSARAFDAAGNQGTSASVPVTVNNPVINVLVTASGTQVFTMPGNTPGNYVGGALELHATGGAAILTGIQVTNTGTVDASQSMGARLYQETVAAGPCAYDATEQQYGTVAAFNAQQKALFTGTATASPGSVLCLYVVLDTGPGMANGSTLEIGVASAADVTLTQGVPVVSLAEVPGSTVMSNGLYVNGTGSQVFTMPGNQPGLYVGGALELYSSGATMVQAITITETGTVDAAQSMGVRLYYEYVSGQPCSYNGTEQQYGIVSSFGTNQKATFTQPAYVAPGWVMCLYPVIDTGPGMANGSTLEIAVASPADISTSGAAVVLGDAAIPGTTVMSNGLYVNGTGSQVFTMPGNQPGLYVGGALELYSSGATMVQAITITETGTVDAAQSMGVRLYYEYVSGQPCSYNGTEQQYGIVSSFGTNQKATFTQTAYVAPGWVMCLYPVIDTGPGMANGSTLEIAVASPADISTSGAAVVLGDAAIPGTTVMTNGLYVNGTGSQVASIPANQANVYVGGALELYSSGASMIQAITITETGTVDAAQSMGVSLFYEYLSGQPCSYGGTEQQYGLDTSFGVNQKATFTQPAYVAPGWVMCLYVLMDTAAGMANGSTLEVAITAPADIATSGATPVLGDGNIPGVSVVENAVTVFASGNQAATLPVNSLSRYVGGALQLSGAGNVLINSIAITEGGTVNALQLTNVRLFREPWTVSGCVYNGTEQQYGTSATFNASNKAVFSAPFLLASGNTECFYVVTDTLGVTVGTTLEIAIGAAADITTGGAAVLISNGAITGTTSFTAN